MKYFRKLTGGHCISFKKVVISLISVGVSGDWHLAKLAHPNCGERGNTEFANCLHTGHKNSPLDTKKKN